MFGDIEPDNEVVSSTIRVKTVLKSADVNILKAHSARAASISKANVTGFSLYETLRRGSFSSASPLQKKI